MEKWRAEETDQERWGGKWVTAAYGAISTGVPVKETGRPTPAAGAGGSDIGDSGAPGPGCSLYRPQGRDRAWDVPGSASRVGSWGRVNEEEEGGQ